MHLDVVSIFPELFTPFRTTGVLGKAVERGLVEIDVHDLRSWAENKWGQVDDEPYGGGAGMVLQAPPVLRAVRALQAASPAASLLVLLTPSGAPFSQAVAEELASQQRVIVLCGRYEGFDERIVDILRPREISLGDFILGGGEVAAMAVIEAVARLLPGVVGDPASVVDDSFSQGLLDHPCYTRPPIVEGLPVPEVLRSGNHEAVRRWRLERAVAATLSHRPDLVSEHWEAYSDEIRELIRRMRRPSGDGEP
jgi:tRNA (guanine37-N1)-methyltransferase